MDQPLVGLDCCLGNTDVTEDIQDLEASPAHSDSCDSGYSDVSDQQFMEYFSVLSPLSSSDNENDKEIDLLLLDSPVQDSFDVLDSKLANYLTEPDTFVDCDDGQELINSYDQLMNTPQVSPVGSTSMLFLPQEQSLRETEKQTELVSAFRPIASVGESVAVHYPVSSTTVSINHKNLPTVKVIKVLKAGPNATKAETDMKIMEALDERNRKNAVQAKMNRRKNKTYLNGLEGEISTLREENEHLKEINQKVVQEKSVLLDEIQYLQNVLANQSVLSNLLQNIENVKNVRLTSSFAKRKRNTDLDHDYLLPAKHSRSDDKKAGVCLHVENDTVSLEFCSKCSQMSHLQDI